MVLRPVSSSSGAMLGSAGGRWHCKRRDGACAAAACTLSFRQLSLAVVLLFSVEEPQITLSPKYVFPTCVWKARWAFPSKLQNPEPRCGYVLLGKLKSACGSTLNHDCLKKPSQLQCSALEVALLSKWKNLELDYDFWRDLLKNEKVINVSQEWPWKHTGWFSLLV